MRRSWFILLLAIDLLLRLPSVAWALPSNNVAWDYDTPLEAGMVLTGFQVRRCTTSACSTSCIPSDLASGAVGAAVRSFSDTAVLAATVYIYDVQAMGTIGGTETRSNPSNQVCRRVPRPAPHRIQGGRIIR